MVTEDIEILPALRLAMIERVGQDRFDLWFGTNTQLRMSEGCLLIESTSRLNLDFLRKNFHEAVCQALTDVQLSGHQVIYREGQVPAKKCKAQANSVWRKRCLPPHRRFEHLNLQLLEARAAPAACRAASLPR